MPNKVAKVFVLNVVPGHFPMYWARFLDVLAVLQVCSRARVYFGKLCICSHVCFAFVNYKSCYTFVHVRIFIGFTGSYAAVTASSACSQCPTNTYSAIFGAISPLQCSSCNPGMCAYSIYSCHFIVAL